MQTVILDEHGGDRLAAYDRHLGAVVVGVVAPDELAQDGLALTAHQLLAQSACGGGAVARQAVLLQKLAQRGQAATASTAGAASLGDRADVTGTALDSRANLVIGNDPAVADVHRRKFRVT